MQDCTYELTIVSQRPAPNGIQTVFNAVFRQNPSCIKNEHDRNRGPAFPSQLNAGSAMVDSGTRSVHAPWAEVYGAEVVGAIGVQ